MKKGLNSMEITIHTLGPSGTNCEMAAKRWADDKGLDVNIMLYDTLEDAQKMIKESTDYLLACIVYPDLHNLVFDNIKGMKLLDCFIVNTFEMVLAAKSVYAEIKNVVSHPAPVSLINERFNDIELTSSNSNAAILTKQGLYDGCITTLVAANEHGLKVIENFGEIEMGFTIHGRR
jgi:prephenate dehydratase